MALAQAAAGLTADMRALSTEVNRSARGMAQARERQGVEVRVEVIVGPGGDRSAENYTRFNQRLQGGGEGDRAADARAVANYLSFFTNTLPLTLPGYGVDASTAGHGYDPAAGEFYRSLFSRLPFAIAPAHGFGGTSGLGRPSRGRVPLFMLVPARRRGAPRAR